MNSLKKALDMRRGKGLEISIMVGEPKSEKREDLGLAPEVKDEGKEEEMEMPMEMTPEIEIETAEEDKMPMGKKMSLSERVAMQKQRKGL